MNLLQDLSPRKHTQLLLKLLLPPLTPIDHPATSERMPDSSLGAQLVFLGNMLLPPVSQGTTGAEPAWVLPKSGTPAQQLVTLLPCHQADSAGKTDL